MKIQKTTSKTAFILATLTLVLSTGGSTASAQAPSTGFGLGAMKVPGADKAKTGKGLSIGRSVFHAGLSVEGGWDSNVYYSDGSPTSSGYMRLLPQLTLGSRPVAAGKRQGFMYNIALGLDYIGYFADMPKKHHIGASLGADLKFNPKGLVSFNIVEQFVRTNEPRVGLDGSVDRDYNQLGFDLIFNKGLLSFLIGYRFILDYHEDAAYSFANRMQHKAKFKATWRFFPQTSFWFLAETGYVDYFEDFTAIGSAAGGNRSSIPLKLWLGATGRLTRWLTADIALGYGFAHYTGSPTSPDHHDIVASAGLGFDLGTIAKLKIGYRHDFQDSLVGDFYKSDSAYLRFNIAVLQKLLLHAVVAYSRVDYMRYFLDDVTGTSCTAAGGSNLCSRQDNYLTATIGADYYFLAWLSAGIGYTLQANISSFDATYTGGGTNNVLPSGFLKHRVFGRVSIFY